MSLFNWQTTGIVVDGGMRGGGKVVVGSNGREGRRRVVVGSNGREGKRKGCGWEVMAGRGGGKAVGGK